MRKLAVWTVVGLGGIVVTVGILRSVKQGRPSPRAEAATYADEHNVKPRTWIKAPKRFVATKPDGGAAVITAISERLQPRIGPLAPVRIPPGIGSVNEVEAMLELRFAYNPNRQQWVALATRLSIAGQGSIATLNM